MYEPKVLNGRSIVLYGAGNDGALVMYFIDVLKIHVDFCVAQTGDILLYGEDNNKQIIVHRPEILDKDKHFVIVASRKFYHEMERFLNKAGFLKDSDYLVWSPNHYENEDYVFDTLSAISPLSEEELSSMIYYSCIHLQSCLYMNSDTKNGFFAEFCCGFIGDNNFSGVPRVEYEGNTDKFVNDILKTKSELIDSLRTNYGSESSLCGDNPCVGCSAVKRGIWPRHNKFYHMDFCLYPSPCNLRCIYCFYSKDGFQRFKTFDENFPIIASNVADCLRNKDLFARNFYFAVSPGEITINPLKEVYYKATEGYPTRFKTNATVFDEYIAKKLTDGKSDVYVSIDAGTNDTYAKIKGGDLFERVRANLKKYSESGNVVLKYILVYGVNDNSKDYEGIINLCRELGLSKIEITMDAFASMSETYFDLTQNLIEFAKQLSDSGIEAYGWEYFITPEARRQIAMALNK